MKSFVFILIGAVGIVLIFIYIWKLIAEISGRDVANEVFRTSFVMTSLIALFCYLLSVGLSS